ncbi:ATP-binding protein [Leptothrix sp. BB-4]
MSERRPDDLTAAVRGGWRQIRDLMWPGPATPDERREQVALVRSNFTIALACACGGAWVLLIALDRHGSTRHWIWGLAYTLYTVVIALRVRAWDHDGAPDTDRRVRWLLLLMAGLGSFWAVLFSALMTAGEQPPILAAALMVTSVQAGALAFTAPLLRVNLAFTWPTLGAAGITSTWQLIEGRTDPLFPTTMAWGLPIYVLANWYFAANAYRSTLQGIRLRFERQDLIHQLAHEHRLSDQARRQAEDADRAKSVFLAAASHDLRQPIHALGLYLSALERDGLGERQLRTLEGVDHALAASRELLDDLLDYSRIEAGVVHARMIPMGLQHLLFRLIEEYGQQADQRALVLRLRDTPAQVMADPILIERIVRNLLSNALRYTARGGVLVAVRRRLGRPGGSATPPGTAGWTIEVWDTGAGIGAADRDDIFRQFYQLGLQAHDHRKGLGLGLAIVKGLCEAMGAQVSLASRPGRGSVFRVHLLAAPAGSERRLLAQAHHAASTAAKDPRSHRLARDLRVLLIDDDDQVRAALVLAILRAGWQPRSAATIDAALEAVAGWHPHIIVSDYRLGEARHGGDAVRLLRERLADPLLPALIVTADTAPDRLRDAQRERAVLLHKPLSAAALIDAIDRNTVGWFSA